MLQTIENVNAAVNNFVWGVPAMVCIIGVGLVLSARTGFIQFRKFGYAIKNSIGRIFTKSEAKEGSITPFQAVCTALAATVGTGNIAGDAGAIAIGGAGAVFWMWVSALLGMCTKFSEVTLAVHYREKNAEGDYVGGPMYYIKNGLGKKWYWMASVYAILGSLTVLGTGNATQVNTITTSIDSALISYNVIDDAQISMVNLVIGIVIAALVAVVLLGGVKRIGTVTEKLVPFMAVFYIILAIGVVVLNADKVPHVFEMIFVGAFNPSAFTGGVVGSMFMTMRRGVSRGIFSNEAGIGTGSIAHACADTDEPVKQGMFGIFEVFADTIVICTLTALVILCGGEGIQYGVAAGAELTISGFVTTYGSWVTIFTAIAMCCFAFSTILGWGLYGARCVEFVFTTKVVKPHERFALSAAAVRRRHQRIQRGPGLPRGLWGEEHRLRQIPLLPLPRQRHHRLPGVPGQRERRRLPPQRQGGGGGVPGQDHSAPGLRGQLCAAGRPLQGPAPRQRDRPLHRRGPAGYPHQQGEVLPAVRPARHRPPGHLHLRQVHGPRLHPPLGPPLHRQARRQRGLLGHRGPCPGQGVHLSDLGGTALRPGPGV